MRYRTGEEIRVGDVVVYAGWDGVVEELVPPGTEFEPDGPTEEESAMILLSYGDRFLLEDTANEEDLNFVRRAGQPG